MTGSDELPGRIDRVDFWANVSTSVVIILVQVGYFIVKAQQNSWEALPMLRSLLADFSLFIGLMDAVGLLGLPFLFIMTTVWLFSIVKIIQLMFRLYISAILSPMDVVSRD